MANLNKTECGCTGIYNEVGMSCDIPPDGVDPCPPSQFWSNLASWDWNAISNTSLTWGYALGIFNQPNSANAQTLAYEEEIRRQKAQMTYLIIAFLIVITIGIIYIAKQNKKRK